MRSNKLLIAITIFTFGFFMSCKDDSLEGVPEWESAVHGFGKFTANSDDINFIKADPSIELEMDLSWISIDRKAEVEKIELYILFNESYIDVEGNPKTAKHGGDKGVLFATYEGAAVPANRETFTFSVTQDDVYALYSAATFDYDDDGTENSVWAGGAGGSRDDRNTTNVKFVDGDTFQLKWTLYTTDGRKFDNWGVSVCTEFPGANCAVSWAAVCSQEILKPVGDWTLQMNDSYGDGWNGAAITVVVNGVGTNYTFNSGSSSTQVVSVPPGTTSLSFEFVSGDWDSEVSYTITSPRGNVVASKSPPHAEGVITLNLCVDNN